MRRQDTLESAGKQGPGRSSLFFAGLHAGSLAVVPKDFIRRV